MFLSQPQLKGRKPLTWESATAQRYLSSRYKTYGLVPWCDARGYEQSFGYGTNVIGLLPGSDEDLADEIVILAAHYDHLGKGRKGIYNGASDNASGVAALLEIAERLSLAEQKPKRSVCFAAFDCEERMLLGSFAFTFREDFDRTKIVAVINIDLLGRDGFNVLQDCLFVVGTEAYPELRRDIINSATQVQLEILPIGTDIVGPRGDHVAFESIGIPAIFFSRGPHEDYHRTTDTADKLNYERMKHSVTLILSALEVLANADKIEENGLTENVYIEELEAIRFLAQEISGNPEKAGLAKADANRISDLANEADRLSKSGDCSWQDRFKLGFKVAEVLGPQLAWPDALHRAFETNAAEYVMELLALTYYNHRETVLEGLRSSIGHLIEHKPGFFQPMPAFRYNAYCVADEEISFTSGGNGQHRLIVLPTRLEMQTEAKGWLLHRGSFGFSFMGQVLDCKGTREQLIDYCLLQWARDLTDESYGQAWHKIMLKVTGIDSGEDYESWVQWRLDQGLWEKESDWALDLMRSDNSELAHAARHRAQKIASKRVYPVIREIISDSKVAVDVRAGAIYSLTRHSDKEVMLAVVEVLDDTGVIPGLEPEYVLDKRHPFYGHPRLKLEAEMIKRYRSSAEELKTLGDVAEKKLKMLTKKNFGKNKQSWQKWIKANIK
ncbi:MAG: M28 family metallopeptidase [Planctomycetota bacterium]